MHFAVLTGDIVGSTALTPTEVAQTHAALERAVANMSHWQPDGTSPLTGFRQRGGDAWQAAVAVPALGLRAALYLRAVTRMLGKGRDTRIALATGEGTLPANGDTNAAHGSVFTASGRLLGEIKDPFRLADARGSTHHAAAVLADHIAQGWTPAQARAIAQMLPADAGDRTTAARRLKITPQAVGQALRAGGYDAINAALKAIEIDAH